MVRLFIITVALTRLSQLISLETVYSRNAVRMTIALTSCILIDMHKL